MGFMQLMRLNHNSILLLQLLVLYASTCLTGYSQNTQMKFMGFSMGMSSGEVIGKLISQDEITAYAWGGHQLTRNDRIELFRNTDTIIPYHENRFKFICPSFLLGTPKPNNMGAQEFSHVPLYKLIFNQFEIQNPSFVFEGDNLVGSTGRIELLFSDYNELITGLDKKYGKGVYNNYLTSWTKDGSVITLWAPIYEQWKRNKKIKVHDNQYKSNNTIFFQFYSLSRVQECIKIKNKKYETDEKELIQASNNRYKLLGISLGITKEEFSNIIEKKGTCEQVGFQDLREYLISHDSVVFSIGYKEGVGPYRGCLSISAYFTTNKLFELTIVSSSDAQTYPADNMYPIIKKFIEIQKPIQREISKSNGMLNDIIIYKKDNDSMYVRYSSAGGRFLTLSLTNTTIKNEKIAKLKLDVSTLVSTFINEIDKGRLIGLQLQGSDFIGIHYKIPNDYNYIKINQATNSKFISTYLLRTSLNQYNVSSINQIDVDSGSTNIYRIREVEVMKRNDSIIAISFSFRPSSYVQNVFTKLANNRPTIPAIIEIKDLLMKELNSKYGAGIEKYYSGRKSIYWIVNNKYIFELILNGTNVFSNSEQLYLSFRLKESDDMILKKKEKKGLLD